MVGNFIGDSVKGNDLGEFPDDIARGIRLHRLIDTYTDQHPVTALSRTRLRPHFRKYAGVVADVFYDHFLALQWRSFHPQPLNEYALEVYEFLGTYMTRLPLKSRRFYSYMVSENILQSYAELEGIDRVMHGMARRARFLSNMEKAAPHLEEYFVEYQLEFNRFFPDLVQKVQSEFAPDIPSPD